MVKKESLIGNFHHEQGSDMRRIIPPLLLLSAVFSLCTPAFPEPVLESCTYHETFENGELNAWASYPLWQDTAYDPNFQVGTVVPADSNLSIVQKVEVFSITDAYAGAQKKLDMYLKPGAVLSLRYYLKTNQPAGFMKIRLAAGDHGKVDCTIDNPPINRWMNVTVSFEDFISQNPRLAGKKAIGIHAVAVLAKIPGADPDMPVYLGLDDITVTGSRTAHFRFLEPRMHKLSEWKPYIPDRHYRRDEIFRVRGTWPFDADRVTISVAQYFDRTKELYAGELRKKDGIWEGAVAITFTAGLYHAAIAAFVGGEKAAETECTLYVVPDRIGGNHPRVWFDEAGKERVKGRLKSERFRPVYDDIVKTAVSYRETMPIDSVTFDIDQFPDEDWLPTLGVWSWGRIHRWKDAVYYNALVYAFDGDIEAGVYAKDVMLKLGTFPYFIHPWMKKRNRHIYYQVAELGMGMAVAYDLVYPLMSEHERAEVRECMMRNVVLGCHKGYVDDNLIITNISNWIAHITGGSILCQAAMYGDGPDVERPEPYFTGAVLKNWEFIRNVTGDGDFAEGYVYFNYSMLSWAKSLPVLERVFGIDVSERFEGTYREFVWAGIVRDGKTFYFGDSSGSLRPSTKAFGSCNDWAWMLDKRKDPLLCWLYNHLKDGDTFMDVLYETRDVPTKEPYDENPIAAFPHDGTTVFKSGWGTDDFVFVMHTGPFFNHQHLDQGTFWLHDRGVEFIGERHGSSYYADPLYQSHYTQPVGHSTILIDGNPQSQRVGDPPGLAEGFDDHAFLHHFLDGERAAFSSGDIGRVYKGKVRSLCRNVLYLKPRTLLMLDTVVPSVSGTEVTLLYQIRRLETIEAGRTASRITIDDAVLHIVHLSPETIEAKAVESPHYLRTLLSEQPLEREGMLTVSAKTDRSPLVMANLLTTTDGGPPVVTATKNGNCVSGTANGAFFAFGTRPGTVYEAGGITTDALVFTRSEGCLFAARCTVLERDGALVLRSDEEITCEVSSGKVKYCLAEKGHVIFGIAGKPSSIMLNGKEMTSFDYNSGEKTVTLELPSGEGTVTF